MKIKLKDTERIDDLEYKGLKIIQDEEGFCFGIDSILLSDFAKGIKDNANVIDLGTGTGIISLLLCKKTNLNKIYGIEIQKEVAQMANRSVQLNELEDKMEIINSNIKDLTISFKGNSIDAVVANPPYKKINTGIINENKAKVISRHEIMADLEDFIKISNYLLKSNGELYMVHRPERLVDIFCLCRKYMLEPKVLRLVYPKKGKKPNLILMKAIKNGKSFLSVENPLIVYNEDDNYTQEILKIYHKT